MRAEVTQYASGHTPPTATCLRTMTSNVQVFNMNVKGAEVVSEVSQVGALAEGPCPSEAPPSQNAS